MKKKLLVISLVSALMLVGCGSDKTTDDKKSSDDKTESAIEVNDDDDDSQKEEGNNEEIEEEKETPNKQYSYRWTGTWVEGGYDGSYTAEDPEIQSMIEANDDAFEDAIIAVAAYNLTKNYMTMAEGATGETFTTDSVYTSNYRFVLGDKVINEEDEEYIMFKSTEYSTEGKEYYILSMKSTGASLTCNARVEVTEDGVIKYAGDDFVFNYLEHTIHLSAPNDMTVEFYVPMEKAKPESVWNALTELSAELTGQNLSLADLSVAIMNKGLSFFEGNVIPVQAAYIDELDEDFSVKGSVSPDFWSYMDENYIDFTEEVAETYANYNITLKPTIFVYQIDEEAGIDMLSIYGKFYNNPLYNYYPIPEDKITDMEAYGYKCLEYKEY